MHTSNSVCVSNLLLDEAVQRAASLCLSKPLPPPLVYFRSWLVSLFFFFFWRCYNLSDPLFVSLSPVMEGDWCCVCVRVCVRDCKSVKGEWIFCVSDLKRFWRSVREFGAKRGGRKRAEGAGGHTSSPFQRELEVGNDRQRKWFLRCQQKQTGMRGEKEKVRKKGGLKISKATNEERKLNKMYTEERESARMKNKGSKKCVWKDEQRGYMEQRIKNGV